MLDEAKTRVFSSIRQQLPQSRLAADQRQTAQILTAFEQQIEREIDERIGLAFGKGRLECREIGGAIFVEGTDLAIEDRIRELPGRGRDGLKSGGPIQALAGLQRNLAVEHPRLDPVAIELDLVDPSASRRRAVQGVAKLRRNEFWEI